MMSHGHALARLAMKDRFITDPPLVSFAELVEPPLEAFHPQMQVKFSRLGLPCNPPSVTAFCAAVASLIMDPDGVALHQHAPMPAWYADVLAWAELVKGHFARKQQALEAWIHDGE
jgi:hypothetical protein